MGFRLKAKDILKALLVRLTHAFVHKLPQYFSVNIRMYVKSSAIEIERDGVKFLMVDKLRPKTKLEDGHIELVSPDPALQRAGKLELIVEQKLLL